MKYLKKFESIDIFDAGVWDDEEDDMQKSFDGMLKLINKELKYNGEMAVKVYKKDWKIFVDFLFNKNIIWKTNRKPEYKDKNISRYENDHIIIIFRYINGIKIGFYRNERHFSESVEEQPLFVFKNKNDNLKIEILWQP